VFYFYGNDQLVGFEIDPSEAPSVGIAWIEGKSGIWGWDNLPTQATSMTVAWGGDYDPVPEGKVEAMKKLSEKLRAERRKKLGI
jgi:hypothetical protein